MRNNSHRPGNAVHIQKPRTTPFWRLWLLPIAGGTTPLACFIRDRRGRDTLQTGLAAPRKVPPIVVEPRPRRSLGAAFTLMFCLAWPRPLVVGAALMAVAQLLEGMQALTPDRSSDLEAAFYGAGGVLAAALLAELFIRARRRANR